MRCHNCKSIDSYRPWEGRITLRGVELMARGEKCRVCDETLFDDAEVQRQERVVAKGIIERGVRDARDFQYVRKVAGLRATELADLLDVSAETISRWENGKQPIPRHAAFIIGELFEHPKLTRMKLEQLAS